MESQTTEYKQVWKDDFLKVISAFANTYGGVLYIGKDDSGNNIGVKNYKKLLENLPNKIHSKLGILVDVNAKGRKEKKIIAIQVNPSNLPVSFNGHFYVRTGSVILELQGQRLSDFLLRKANNSWDNISHIESSINDIDENTIELFKGLAMDRLPSISNENNIWTILSKLNLVENKNLKRAAILLFGKNIQKYFPQYCGRKLVSTSAAFS